MDFKITKHRWRILLWFATRPKFYKQFLREAKTFITRKGHPSLASCPEAERWCAQREVDIENAFERLFPSHLFMEVTKLYPEVFEEGMEITERESFNWGGQGNISLNYNLAEALEARNVLETGVAYGWSTLSILLSLSKRSGSKLVSVDMPFIGVTNEEDIGCVVPKKLCQQWTLIPYPDREGIPKALNCMENPDFCHYDSDKSHSGKIWALPKLFGTLRQGGILAVDDISDNLAFIDFCEQENLDPIVIKTFDTQVIKHVGLIKKIE